MVAAARRHLEDLEADARYRRERVELYRARAYGGRPASPAKLRELEREAAAADDRLAAARRASAQ